MSAGSLASDIGVLRNTVADVERFMAGRACNDPMKIQLEEMLYGILSRQDLTQTVRFFIPNAAALSDEVYQPGSATSLQMACRANDDFAETSKDIAWCSCVAQRITSIAPERVAGYTKRYKQFLRDMSEVRMTLDRGQEHPDARIYYTWRSCAT